MNDLQVKFNDLRSNNAALFKTLATVKAFF